MGAKQAWFAEDAASGGRLVGLQAWWDRLNTHGPLYGYFPNCGKTNLVVMAQHVEKARSVIQGTKININTEGKRYLGGTIGTSEFTKTYSESKVAE